MKQPYIGAHLADICLSDFVKHGIPVPVYAQNGELLLLFKNNQECKNYTNLLAEIGAGMKAADPLQIKSHIQAALIFIARLNKVLNYD